MAPDGDVTRALDSSGKVALRRQVMALNGGARNEAFFMNKDITAGLNSAIPAVANLVVLQADVGSALGTECGSGIWGIGVLCFTVKTANYSGFLCCATGKYRWFFNTPAVF